MVLRRSTGLWVCGGLLSLSVACSGPDGAPGGGSAGQTASASGSGGGGPGGGGGAGGAGSAGAPDPGLLPDGAGREYRGVVNLVNAQAAKALDDYLLDADPFLGGSGQLSLALPLKLFYTHYGDDYDFIYFFTDHGLNTTVRGLYGPVNRPPMPGTGKEQPYTSGLGPARLRSSIAIQLPDRTSFPPLAHELAHYYGVELAPEFGFGKDVDSVFSGHWGMVSANGQLGGFDAATLQCEAPAGAKPPGCTPNEAGRYRYKVARFFPNTVSKTSLPYGPMELYLMGLLPAAEAPQSLLRIDGADFPFDSLMTDEAGMITLEGTGVSEISLSQIIERHGTVPLLPEDKRHFKAAMVLITAAPATQEYLDRVADVAAIFGGEQPSSESPSFAELTGNRATMTCKLGERHPPQTPPDEYDLPPYLTCSPEQQDCAEGMACYGLSHLYCAKPGMADKGQACERDSDCKAGFVCGSLPPDFTEAVCTPYCDAKDATAPDACATLCPGGFSTISNADGSQELGAVCYPGSGGSCDPLAQDCEEGRACTGVEAPSCRVPGAIGLDAPCTYATDCVKGLVCVKVQGDPTAHCQEYCDPSPAAPESTSCDKCDNGAWDFPGGYGICIP